MIKTTFATEVFIIANTKAIKLNDITKPPNNAGRPDFIIILAESFLQFADHYYRLQKEIELNNENKETKTNEKTNEKIR